MYQYKYVSLDADGFFGGRGFTAHREIIETYAAQGFRYVGYMPTHMNREGALYEIDLIFERDYLEEGEEL